MDTFCQDLIFPQRLGFPVGYPCVECLTSIAGISWTPGKKFSTDLGVGDSAVTLHCRIEPWLSTSKWRLRPLTRLPESYPMAVPCQHSVRRTTGRSVGARPCLNQRLLQLTLEFIHGLRKRRAPTVLARLPLRTADHAADAPDLHDATDALAVRDAVAAIAHRLYRSDIDTAYSSETFRSGFLVET